LSSWRAKSNSTSTADKSPQILEPLTARAAWPERGALARRPAIIVQENNMVELHSASDQAQVLDTMIGLTRLTNLQRAIIAGGGGMELYLGLRRRGFMRVATISTSWVPRRQHAIGLLADRNATSLEKALTDMSPFLCTNSTVAVLIDSYESSSSLKVRAKLQQMGFQIEAGVRCHQGLVLSACRQGFNQIEKAA
jgi:hypothetical protein